MIKMTAIGHIGKDCVVKEVNGKNVINFSVAHTEKYKDSQGVQHESTTWVECAYWSDKVSIAQYLTKGKQVYVEGIPSSDSYMKDNKSMSTLRLRVMQVQLLGGAESANSGAVRAPQSASAYTSQVENNNNDSIDDLPF